MNNISVRKVNTNEIDVVLEMLLDAALWIKTKSPVQWQEWQKWLNPTEERRTRVQADLDKGRFFYISDNDEIIGMYNLEYKNNKTAYLHVVVTKRIHKGKGFGALILSHIEAELKGKNITTLCLNCVNEKTLCSYYEKHNFRRTGTVTENGIDYILYEKRL